VAGSRTAYRPAARDKQSRHRESRTASAELFVETRPSRPCRLPKAELQEQRYSRDKIVSRPFGGLKQNCFRNRAVLKDKQSHHRESRTASVKPFAETRLSRSRRLKQNCSRNRAVPRDKTVSSPKGCSGTELFPETRQDCLATLGWLEVGLLQKQSCS
jgi:hypothetical protein